MNIEEMRATYPIGTHVRFNDAVPNGQWAGVTGVVESHEDISLHDGCHFVVKVDNGVQAPLLATGVYGNGMHPTKYVEILSYPHTDEDIEQAMRDLDRILEGT